MEFSIYLGLFWNAFIAATILPAFSEVALAALLETGNGKPLLLFIAATTGNVAGSTVNWWMGLRISDYQSRRWFPFNEHQIGKATKYFERYGKWSLLLAWLPIIGDPLTLVAGVLRTNFATFLMLVTVGKALRYGAILYLVL